MNPKATEITKKDLIIKAKKHRNQGSIQIIY